MIRFILNEKEVATGLPPGFLLLDYIRYHRRLMGTKIGCREGDCGACTIVVGEIKNDELVYASATACLMPLANAAGKHIVTIEGINGNELSPVQQAMSDEAATQCGFCTPGFVVSLAGFCLNKTVPTEEMAIAAINGNICRCTGYKSIERAARKVSGLMQERTDEKAIDFAIGKQVVPAYFKDVKGRLQALPANGQLNGLALAKCCVGGGTDLYVQQPEAMVHTRLDTATSKQNLRRIYREENRCFVGAAATVTDLLSSPVFQTHFPQLNAFIKLVSSTPIRNMATIAGNLVNASPIGDLTIFFLALDAQVVLSDGKEERTIALRNFYRAYKQLDKQNDELVTAIFFELPRDVYSFNFEKVSKRTHLDIASVNSAMLIKVDGRTITEASLSAGGVGPVPLYLRKTSSFLSGKAMTEDTVLAAVNIAQTEISPISDVRGSEAYKRLLLSQLIKAHFIKAFPQLAIEKLLNHA